MNESFIIVARCSEGGGGPFFIVCFPSLFGQRT